MPDLNQAGRGGAGYSRAMAAVAWVVIGLCLGLVAYTNWRASRTTARLHATEDFQLQLGARVVLGEFRVFGRNPAVRATLAKQAIPQLSGLASDATQKLRLAAVIGELQGGKAALAALDAAAPLVQSAEGKSDLATLRTIYSTAPAAVPPPAREELARRQGWFGDLALSFGRPDSDPLRARVIRAAEMAFLTSATVELLALAAALAGFGLLIFAIVRLATGRLHLCYGRWPTQTTAFLESFAIYLAGHVSLGWIAHALAPRSAYLGFILSLLWLPFAMLWPLARGVGWTQLTGGLGWYRGRGIVREIGAGLLGYVVGLPLIVLSIVVTILLTTRTHSNAAHPIAFGDTHGFWAIVELYLLAAVLAPLIEETMFRGALFTHLRQRHGWLLAAVASSFIFAALHPQGWTAIPALGTIGFVLAGIREWRGTFVASAAAHALNNAIVATVLVLALR